MEGLKRSSWLDVLAEQAGLAALTPGNAALAKAMAAGVASLM